MRIVLIFVFGIVGSPLWIYNTCGACLLCVCVCVGSRGVPKVYTGKNTVKCYFVAFQRMVMRFRPRMGSTYVHRHAALPALSGRWKVGYRIG